MINYRKAGEITAELMEEFDVRAPGPDTKAQNLSGGNQQKLIIARELYREPDVLLAVQPTRGLDVGAIEFVHAQLVTERDKGRGILLVSFDLDEIIDLSDRDTGDLSGPDCWRVSIGQRLIGPRLAC